jgi:predicted nucleic acid-binding protein
MKIVFDTNVLISAFVFKGFSKEDDNNILLLAKFIKAKYIVTGDSDLLSLIEYEGIQIESPRGFWEKEIKEEEKKRTPSRA